MKKSTKKGLRMVTLLIAILLVVNMTGVVQAEAATKSVTPMKEWRYVRKTANYQVNSTLKEYQDIWTTAAGKWCDKGFQWVKKDKAKTSVSTYSDSSLAGLKVAGKCETTYRVKDGYIIKNRVLLNRAALDKYEYTKEQRICVAEHELGHALGLAHNNGGSVSVMNPANRVYDIKSCDVKGMEKRYATKISNDVVNEEDSVTVTEYFYVDAPSLKNVKVKYSNHKITITGKAQGVNQVIAKYGSVEKTATVNSGEFKVQFSYNKAKSIRLYGVNSKREKITTTKIIKSDRYITADPVCTKLVRSKKGLTCYVQTEAGSLLTIKNNGKIIKKMVVDSSSETVFISEKKLKGKKGKLIFTQKNTNKKVSQKVSYPIINIGECMQTEY